MNWITLVAVLVAWPLLGLAVAYLFGRFIHGVEVSADASNLAPPVVSYLRRMKRAKTIAHTKVRREATSGRRSH